MPLPSSVGMSITAIMEGKKKQSTEASVPFTHKLWTQQKVCDVWKHSKTKEV